MFVRHFYTPPGRGCFFFFIQPSGRASTPMGGHPPPWVGIHPNGWAFFFHPALWPGIHPHGWASTPMGGHHPLGVERFRRLLRCRKKRSASTQMQEKGRRKLRCRIKCFWSHAGNLNLQRQKILASYLGTSNCLIGEGLNTKSGHVKRCHDTPG